MRMGLRTSGQGQKDEVTAAVATKAKGKPKKNGAEATPKAPPPLEHMDTQDTSATWKAAPAASRDQLRRLLQTVRAVRQGDFSVRLPVDEEGIVSEIGEV